MCFSLIMDFIFGSDKFEKGLHHSTHVYRWAQAFFRIEDPKTSEKVFYVVYKRLKKVQSIAQCTIRGQSWSAELHAMKVSSVLDIVGIWKYSEHIYLLRRHPGLAMLSIEERGEEDSDDGNDY